MRTIGKAPLTLLISLLRMARADEITIPIATGDCACVAM